MPEKGLIWQPGFSLSRKPVRRSAPRRNKHQQFEFVVEYPVKLYEPRANPQSEAIEEKGPSIDTPHCPSSDESLVRSEESPDVDTTDGISDARPYLCDGKDHFASSSPTESTIDGQLQIFDESTIGHDASHDRSSQGAATGPSLGTFSVLANIPCSPCTSVPPTIEFSSLSQRFEPILNRYNREFCTIPLTFDLRINPFRYRTNLDPEPMFLVHAVMALAGHHVESTSTPYHRHTSLKLLRQSLTTYSNTEIIYSMLDTIIILFSLDETQSALGNWSTHLVGAYGLLEACGGIKTLATSARVDAQIGILTWWDAITSLLSREDCVFPYTYFDAILSNQDCREWDFFGLCGCPTSLVKIVMEVARLSAKRRKASSTKDVTFDTTAISEMEQSLESWHHVPAATALRDEECMQQDQDAMHCSEAWRNGLLLYIFRVFQWELGTSIPTRILWRARVIVDHVVSCRDVTMMSRQALLPLFFAGCELRDRSTRMEILRFCSVWNERTRYHMFSSTVPLLEELWAEQEAKGFENVWWGQVVDKQHTSESDRPLQMRLCFG